MEFDGYQIVRFLGKGGMGEVYEAVGVNGEHVALKVFTCDRGNAGLLKERFRIEAEVLKRLGDCDRSFARFHGFGFERETGRPWFAMDLVLGPDGAPETLEQARRKGGIDERTLQRWLVQLATALRTLHARGIVHRDVKLENVLLTAAGDAVLTDFGVSRVVDDVLREELVVSTTFVTGETTGTRPVMGSYWYLAPEVRAGAAATPAADWYALGVLFFRLLTGMWYEPDTRAFDLLAPFPAFWRNLLPRLLDADPVRRIPPVGGPASVPAARNWTRRICLSGLVLVLGGALTAGFGGLFPWGGGDRPRELVMRNCGGYALSETPVTRHQWWRVMGGDRPARGTGDCPRTNIAWDEATNFCARLSEQRGGSHRLPTAAEWQAAYRKGRTTPVVVPEKTMDEGLRREVCRVGWFGQGVSGKVEEADRWAFLEARKQPLPTFADIAPGFPPRRIHPGKDDWARHSCASPMPVALKPANRLGLYDMAGNVFEMVQERVVRMLNHSWCDTEVGFRLDGIVPAESGTELSPVMFGQPFTPGLPGDEPWGSYFDKMPHLGFRVAADEK